MANFQDFLELRSFRERRDEKAIYIHHADMQINLPESFMQMLTTDPTTTYPAMEMATYRFYKQLAHGSQILTGPDDCFFVPRILDWPITPLKQIKSHFIGRFVSVSGTVIRASLLKERVTWIIFKCAKCGANMPRVLEDGKFVPPMTCVTSRCNTKKFDAQFELAKTVACQTIRVQESIQGINEDGKLPRMFDVELLDQLTEACVPVN